MASWFVTLAHPPRQDTARAGEIGRWDPPFVRSQLRIPPALVLAFTLALFPALHAPGAVAADPAGAALRTSGPTLTTLREVRELSPTQAAEERVVRLEGQLSFVDHSRFMCFLQDPTGGVYLETEASPEHRAGMRVRLEATTRAGRFTPFLKASSLLVLEPAALPRPPVVEVHEFKAGFLEGERMALEGRIVSAGPAEGRLRLKLATGGELLTVWIHHPAGADSRIPANARVRIAGICAGVFNDRNEITDFHLHATDESEVTLVAPPPDTEPAVPTQPIRSLELGWRDAIPGRVRCRGTVTLHWPGQFLFITDGTSSLELRTDEQLLLHPGDEVEVTGLRSVAHRRMILADCSIRKLGHTGPWTPSLSTLDRIRSRHSHGDAVRLDGDLVEINLHDEEIGAAGSLPEPPAGPSLVLRQGNRSIRAELPPGSGWRPLDPLQPRSRIRVSGVLAALPASPGEAMTYRLLLGSVSDILVLQEASWWTLRRASVLLGGIALFLLSAMGWVVGLNQNRRRRAEKVVRRQREKSILHRDALLELTRLVQTSRESDSLRSISELVARTLSEPRVSVWRMENEGREMVCLDLYAHGRHTSGERLSGTDFGAYFAALRETRIIAAEDARNDPRTSEFTEGYLIPNNIYSMLDVSLRFHGQPSGVLCIEHVGERRAWDVEEQNFAAAVADQLTLLREATERLRAEQALREAHAELEIRVMLRTTELAEARDRAEAADRIKSAFLATMSHELRTPLNSILGFTGILLQGLVGPLSPEQRKQLGMVQNSARHLLSLINDVLDISKIEAGQVEITRSRFEIPDVITRVVDLVTPLAERKGLRLEVQLPPTLPVVTSDRRRVEQILINLLNNAIKFTERGGVRIECRTSADDLELRVIDSGIGIREEHLARLFKPFQQLDSGLARHHEGTGLGLAICAGFVKLLRGSIRVESEYGQGSTFILNLPIGAREEGTP